MQRYILIRLVQAIFVLFFVSIIVFALARASGNPVDLMLPIDATPQDHERLTAFWGLDKPVHVQYGKFLVNALQGDFGQSIKWTGESAMGMVLSRIPASIHLAGTAMGFAVVLALVLGVVSAVKKDSFADVAGKVFGLVGQSAPAFWIGIMLIWIFAVALGWFPTSGRGGLKHMVLPVITLGWFQVAALMRLTRSSMLESLDSEYVKLARIKGLSEGMVVWKHCLRNAAISPLTYVGIIAGTLVLGSVIVETVFSWPGIGMLTVEAVVARDFQVVQAATVFYSVVIIGTNLVVDILYAYVDPRIRYG